MKNIKGFKVAAALCTVLVTASCSTSPKGDGTLTFVETDADNTLTVCHFDQVKNTIDINLSDLVEEFKIVRFENSDSAFFKGYGLCITDHYIGIRQSNNLPFLLFTHDGKLKCQVGAIGNGPEEYNQSIYDEVINEKTKEIYLASFAFLPKILVYNTDGKFVREIVTKEKLSKPKIEVDDDGDITIIHMPFENNKEKFLTAVYDKGGSFKQELKPTPNFLQKDFNQDIFAYHNVPGFSFWLSSCDTLFHYDKNANKIHPKFKMDFGGVSEIPLHIYNELPGYYLTAMLGGKGVIAVNKEKQTSNYAKLINDFFGHMEAPIFNFSNGWFYQMNEPGWLIAQIEKRLAESSCSDEDRKQLKELLDTIDTEDNNILFMGKLK